MNKKGGEKYLSIWWYFVLVILCVGVVIGVVVNAFAESSVKKMEAEILLGRVLDCVIDTGQINYDYLDGDFDIFEKCYISREKIADKGYLALGVYDYDSCLIVNKTLKCDKLVKEIARYGDFSLKRDCEIFNNEKPSYPYCEEEYVYVLNRSQKLVLWISTGSNRRGVR